MSRSKTRTRQWPPEYRQRIGSCDEPEYPWRDKELVEFLYLKKKMTQFDMAELFDCSQPTIRKWIGKHNIPKRTRSEVADLETGGPYNVAYRTDRSGYSQWRVKDQRMFVHRLLAVAEWGADAVAGNVVHHKNEIPWDNRIENLEIMGRGEHSTHHHTKLNWSDKMEIEEQYHESDDETVYSLASEYDVSAVTISNVIKEVRERIVYG